MMGILLTTLMVHSRESEHKEVLRPLIGGWDASVVAWAEHVGNAKRVLMFIAVATMSCCYALWLSQGCKAFLPFISDLGLDGAMRILLPIGAVSVAALLAYTYHHVTMARHALCTTLRLPAVYKGLNVVGSAGLFTAICGVAAIGFFPWSTDLSEHFCCVYCIFYGGFVWGILSAAMSIKIAKEALHEVGFVDEQHSTTRWLPLPFALLSICAWLIMLWCFYRALDGEGISSLLQSHVETKWWDARRSVTSVNPLLRSWQPYGPGVEFLQQRQDPSSDMQGLLHLAATDFPQYCRGEEGSWHGNSWVNTAALMEWTLVGCLLGTVVVCVTDLNVYAAMP
jgi:hypothetical protein